MKKERGEKKKEKKKWISVISEEKCKLTLTPIIRWNYRKIKLSWQVLRIILRTKLSRIGTWIFLLHVTVYSYYVFTMSH